MTDRHEGTTMTTYTAEDFANAEFARHPDGRTAARVDSGDSMPWRVATGSWLGDADMAEEGFVPVREAHPITFDALQAAWGGAEQAEECEPGDVVIRPGEDGRYEVIPVKHGTRLWGETRILHRAPRPKRVEDDERLKAMLRALVGDPALLADWLAERGVPVTEEGEK